MTDVLSLPSPGREKNGTEIFKPYSGVIRYLTVVLQLLLSSRALKL